MGFGDLASQLILFIAIVTISIGVIFIFNSFIAESTSAVSSRQDFLSNQLRTSLTIESVSYANSQVILYVRNTGDTILRPNTSTVYINQERVPLNQDIAFVLEQDTDTRNIGFFDPNEILKITINRTLEPAQTHTVLLVSQYNTRSTFDFST